MSNAHIPAANLRLKRAYAPAAAGDGTRILIDRLWPRGISKQRAALDEWLKEIAPSTELRQWFGHEPARWPEFSAESSAPSSWIDPRAVVTSTAPFRIAA